MPDGGDPLDEASWRIANPSLVERGPGVQLGEIRATARSAAKSEELRNVFVVESLGTGEWYPRDGDDEVAEYVIDPDEWQAVADVRRVSWVIVALAWMSHRRARGLAWSPPCVLLAVFTCRSPRSQCLTVMRLFALSLQRWRRTIRVAVVIETKGVGATLLGPPRSLAWSRSRSVGRRLLRRAS